VAVFFARRFGNQDNKSDQVATTVEVGPDGAYYVGTLGGVLTPKNTTRVYRVVEGEEPTVFADGLTMVTSIAFGPDGSLYATELSAGGWRGVFRGDLIGSLIKITPEGERTEIAEGQLVAPGGVVVTDDGDIYVTTFSVFPKRGKVVKIEGAP
jgi:sugar lactone lactonase YvrE